MTCDVRNCDNDTIHDIALLETKIYICDECLEKAWDIQSEYAKKYSELVRSFRQAIRDIKEAKP